MKFPADLPETDIVSIHEAEVSGLIRIGGVELHVGGLGEGGRFVVIQVDGGGICDGLGRDGN